MKNSTQRMLAIGLVLSVAFGAAAQSRMDAPRVRNIRSGLIPYTNTAAMDPARGGGYCAASATGSVDFGLDERIVNVSFANINNASPNTAPVAPAYTLYTTPVGNVNAGATYTLSVDVNTTSLTTGFPENQVLAWIDFNQDFDFDDAGEQVLVSAIAAQDVYSGSVTIPAGAALGTTRMRIRLHDTHDGTDYINVFNNTPCGAASYGEIEDYLISISGGGSAPANNECANATSIGVNATCFATQGTTENATQSLPPAACSGFTASVANDVWYSFTATQASTTISVTGAGDATTGMDPVLEAFSGSCGALTSLGCVDATARAGTETLTIATTPGSVYRYRVYHWPYAGQSLFVFTTCVIASGGGPGYCPAGADGTGLGLDERIVNVTFAGINNSSPDAAPVAPAYTDFTAVSGTVQQGQSYPISIDVASTGATTSYDENQAIAWIDWNQDNDFEDAGEQVFVSDIGSVEAYTGTIPVPAGAPLGATRMRIRLHDTHDGSAYTNNLNDTPCGLASYGEVEDYTINVTAGGGTTPPNDDCTGAVAVALSTPGTIALSGDNTGATIDPPTQFVVVWEAFTITECSNITLNFCQPGSVFTSFFVSLATSCPLDIVGGVINGANDECNVYFFGLAPGTYYIPVRVEADGSTPVGAYTIGVAAEPCANPGPYCEAGADAVLEEKIGNVTFAGINNDSASPAGYEDFTTLVASVVGGQSYPISITVAGGYSTDQGIVWIDWNQDSDFEDAGEQVYISAAGAGPYTGTVNVPLTAAEGLTRMRVRLHDTYTGSQYANTPNATPCGNSTYGQVEDYTVDVIGIITGISGADEAAFGVYPNPTHGRITIRTGSLGGNVRFDVIDALGRLAYSDQRVVNKASSVALDLAGRLAPGTYLLRLTNGDAREEQRIIVR